MVNEWKNIAIFMAILILIIVLIYYPNISHSNVKEYSKTNLQASEDMFSNVQKLHYTKMPITYGFKDNNCGDYQKRRIIRAFEEIKNETGGVVYFIENNYSSMLSINCINNFPINGAYVTSGEGGYRSLGNQITEGFLNFYNAGPEVYSGGCSIFMDVEIHEILHTFGYQHVEGYGSIMQPISPGWCNVRKIDDSIVKDLIENYGQQI